MKSCSKVLRILVITVHFIDWNWISKFVYFQPNLPIKSGVYPSLHLTCHHQIFYTKFNLDIVYPPLYESRIWYYQKASINLIKRAINEFDWDKAFSNIDVDKTVYIFLIRLIFLIITKYISNILCNFICQETVLFDGRDPPRVKKEIK